MPKVHLYSDTIQPVAELEPVRDTYSTVSPSTSTNGTTGTTRPPVYVGDTFQPVDPSTYTTIRPPQDVVPEQAIPEEVVGTPPFFGSGGGGGGAVPVEEEMYDESRMAMEEETLNPEAEKALKRQKMIIFGLIGLAVLIAGFYIYRRMKKKGK